MRYFTSDTHFGHPLVTALRGFLNNGRLRAEYRDVWQAQGRAAAHTWIKQYVRDNQTSFKAICDITRHENTIIGNITRPSGVMTSYGFSAISPTVAPSSTRSTVYAASTAAICT